MKKQTKKLKMLNKTSASLKHSECLKYCIKNCNIEYKILKNSPCTSTINKI